MIGLLQGAALWMLYHALEAKAWPATEPSLFAPLVMVAVFVPILVLVGLGNVRGRVLLAWTAVATLLCAGLALHDVLRGDLVTTWQRSRIAAPVVWFVLPAMLFIGHVFVAAGAADRRVLAFYPQYFDLASKLALQLALTGLFVGVFWLVLWLGTELFRLIRIEYVRTLIQQAWFWVPVTTLMVSLGIHVTDTQTSILRGVRALALTLLAWLLPLIALIAVAFLAALPFTGLEPIWNTRRATALMLAAAAALVVLLNAAYQEGGADRAVSPLLRWSGRVAALALAPVVAIAAYGLMLRVDQYGWSVDRIYAAACIGAAACYAVGYGVAALRPGRWMQGIALTNVATAVVGLGLLLALFTPVADPSRLAVNDQVSRLLAGRVAPEQFDFQFLRFRSGRYGLAALDQLKVMQGSPDQERIARLANQALDARFPALSAQAPVTGADRRRNIVVLFPRVPALPDDFLEHDWTRARSRVHLPGCLTYRTTCEAAMIDVDGDGTDEILLFPLYGSSSYDFGSGAVAFKRGPAGTWAAIGPISNANCQGVRDAVRNGHLSAIAPEPKDLGASGHRMRIIPPCG